MRIALALCFALSPGQAAAQRSGLWLDAGAGEARLSTSTNEAPLRYGTLGLRGVWDPRGPWLVRGLAGLGRGSDELGGAGWWLGEAGVAVLPRLGGTTLGLAIDGWAVRYDQDLLYSARGARLTPTLEWRAGPLAVRARGEGIIGRWRLKSERRRGPPANVPVPIPVPPAEEEVAEATLSMVGGALDLVYATGPGWVRLSPGAYRARGRVAEAWQHLAEAEAGLALGPVTLAAGPRWVSRVPLGEESRRQEWGARARARLALDPAWAVTAQYDSRPWDPVHAVLQGASFHLGVEWRWLPPARRGPPVAELGPAGSQGRSVRFRLKTAGAERVELIGDFSDWRPLRMTRRGDVWETEVMLPPGTHQFAFLVDGGSWTIPDHAPGIVEDGWNRRNATLVIPERPQ